MNARVREYAAELAEHENIHVKALQDTIRKLGGTPVAKPNIDFSPLLTNSDGTAKTVNDELFLALANTFEPIGVRAYLGQADKIMNGDVLTAAASILAVEAKPCQRHPETAHPAEPEQETHPSDQPRPAERREAHQYQCRGLRRGLLTHPHRLLDAAEHGRRPGHR